MPKTTTEILTNLKKSMDYLKKYNKIKQRFLWSEKSVLAGNSDIIWGLLYDIFCFYTQKNTNSKKPQKYASLTQRNFYPKNSDNSFDKTNIPKNSNLLFSANSKSLLNTPTRNFENTGKFGEFPLTTRPQNTGNLISFEQNELEHLKNINLNYSLIEIRELEKSILVWLNSIIIIQYPNSKLVENMTIFDILPNIKNGTLLCELANIFLKNSIKMSPCKTPRTQIAALNNIRKSLEVFRKLKGISHKYLWNEKEIYKGDISIILGLFEDLHKYYDGIKDTGKTGKPYLGKKIIEIPTEKSTPPNEQIQPNLINSHTPPKINTYENHEFIDNSAFTNENTDFIQKIPIPDNKNTPKIKSQILPKILCDWINSVLKTKQKITADLLKDGILLYNLLSKLEHKTCEGINLQATTSAACLHNIKIALGLLKNKQSVPVYLLYCDREIYEGNYETIVNLLKSIKFAYHAILSNNDFASKSMQSYDEGNKSGYIENSKFANSFF